MKLPHLNISLLALLCGSQLVAPMSGLPSQQGVFADTTQPAVINSLTVDLDGGKSVVLPLDELAKLPHESVKVTEKNGSESEYSGVPIGNVLALVDAPSGKALRGKNLALYVVAEASDGYKATFSIVETDPAFGDRHIIIADRCNGEPLPARSAPLQIIVPDDKLHARWVRMLVALHIRRVA